MLRPLVGAWVQVLFHSPRRGSFHRSLTVLCAIGLTGVFSLAGWARQIRAGLLVSRVTQDTTKPCLATTTGLSPAMAELSRTFVSRCKYYGVVLQPHRCHTTPAVWAPPRSLATTGGIINLFSLPRGTKMFQFPRFASCNLAQDSRPSDGWVVPFGNRGIKGYLLLPRAYRSLSRPSSPP